MRRLKIIKRKSALGIALAVMLTLMLGGCGSGKETLPGNSNTEGVSSVNFTSSEDTDVDSSNEVFEEQTTQEDDSECCPKGLCQ